MPDLLTCCEKRLIVTMKTDTRQFFSIFTKAVLKRGMHLPPIIFLVKHGLCTLYLNKSRTTFKKLSRLELKRIIQIPEISHRTDAAKNLTTLEFIGIGDAAVFIY